LSWSRGMVRYPPGERRQVDFGLMFSVAKSFNGKNLPYIEGVVNLLIVDQPLDVVGKEIERVLAPRGVLLVKSGKITDHRSLVAAPSGLEGWLKFTKPVPETIDDWPHFIYDAAATTASKDTVAHFPEHMQWQAGPVRARHTERTKKHLPIRTPNGPCTGNPAHAFARHGLPCLPTWQFAGRDLSAVFFPSRFSLAAGCSSHRLTHTPYMLSVVTPARRCGALPPAAA
jgi:hypothetical protein